MSRTYPQYDVAVTKGRETARGTTTRKRQAIRTARALLRQLSKPAKGEVRVRQPGKARGTLIYQAHLAADGKIVDEEL